MSFLVIRLKASCIETLKVCPLNMFTETYFKTNCNHFSESPDLWMRAFFRLHVPSDYKNDKQF